MEQRYNFFCDQRCLILYSGNGKNKPGSGINQLICKSEDDFYQILKKWLNKLITNDLCLNLNSEISSIENLINQKYKEVSAAGGLVINAKNEVLFIFRSGVWDLPKGHVEDNESFAETAMREVEEETGLTSMELLHELTVTRHFYFSKGKWEVKLTKWFLMLTNDTVDLKPQLSEGIEKAVWISENQLDEVLQNSFRSVRESLEIEKVLRTRH
jgi:8-oxo-dGTP pyrophosphatase MutT (NUDIX family)